MVHIASRRAVDGGQAITPSVLIRILRLQYQPLRHEAAFAGEGIHEAHSDRGRHPRSQASLHSSERAAVSSNLEQDTLGNTVDELKGNPDTPFEYSCRLTSKPSATKADSAHWNETYVHWRSNSKAWLPNSVVDLGGPSGPTARVIGNLDENNQDSIPNLYLLFFGIRGENNPQSLLAQVGHARMVEGSRRAPRQAILHLHLRRRLGQGLHLQPHEAPPP